MEGRWRWLGVATALWWGSAPARAQQGGELTGFSVLSAGRAGAGNAAADSMLDAARNPAVLGFLFTGEARRPRSGTAEIGARGFWSPGSATDTDGRKYDYERTLQGSPLLGWATEVAPAYYFGVSLLPTFGGGGMLTHGTELEIGTPTRTRDVELNNQILQAGLHPALAWTVGDDLAFGIGASLRYTESQIQGAQELDVIDTFAGDSPFGVTWGELFSGPPFNISTIQAEFDGSASEPVMGLASFGMMWQAGSDTRVSAWYRSPSNRVDLSGEIFVDLEPEMGPILDFYGLDQNSDFDIDLLNVQFPDQIGLAVSHEASSSDRLHLDLVWTNWSRTFDGWTARLSNPSSKDFKKIVGNQGVTIVDIDLRWKDAYTASLGYEHDFADDWTLRGGVGWSSDVSTDGLLPGAHPFNTWYLALGASIWGQGGDWHFAAVAGLPETLQSGENNTLSDLSFDEYEQAYYSLAVGYTLRW